MFLYTTSLQTVQMLMEGPYSSEEDKKEKELVAAKLYAMHQLHLPVNVHISDDGDVTIRDYVPEDWKDLVRKKIACTG